MTRCEEGHHGAHALSQIENEAGEEARCGERMTATLSGGAAGESVMQTRLSPGVFSCIKQLEKCFLFPTRIHADVDVPLNTTPGGNRQMIVMWFDAAYVKEGSTACCLPRLMAESD